MQETTANGQNGTSHAPSDMSVVDAVKHYYGRVLATKHDLKTTACCAADSYPTHIKQIISQVHPEILEKSYGCGVPIPVGLEGATVLDMGCGAGRDAYLLSKLVGPTGRVLGIDMTAEQLQTAKKHQAYHCEAFGYEKSNVTFIQGYMEDLQSAGIESNSVDVVVSNCVFNLSPSKELLFKEILRVLKPGGELYFSDVFADRRLPAELSRDPVLLGECLGGAIYIQDFRRMLSRLGVADYRVMSQTPIRIDNDEVLKKTGLARFSSITIRAFKLDLEDQCEDFGQAAMYHGTIPGCEEAFELDDHHLFVTGKLLPVCGNSAAMVRDTRFGRHFTIYGEGKTHYGLFPCGPEPVASADMPVSSCC